MLRRTFVLILAACLLLCAVSLAEQDPEAMYAAGNFVYEDEYLAVRLVGIVTEEDSVIVTFAFENTGTRYCAVTADLSPAMMAAYTTFEKEKVLEFQDEHADESNANILANSAAGLMNKLSQFANGAIYDEDRNVHSIHDEKLDRLAELIEAANGNSVLVFYQYKHDVDRIVKKLKGYRVKVYKDEKELKEWNAGNIDVLLAHPASTAFGLNMQQGGHYIVWYGTGWNLELYQQANARLHRQGQQYPVQVYKLVCANTVDERAEAALDNKKGVQQSLLDSLNYLLRKHGAVK